MVRQRHLGRRKSAHPLQRLHSEETGEVVLPRLDMQPIVLDRRRRRHGMSPRAADPLDPAPVVRVARHPLQCIQNIVQAHLPHPVQQGAGVLQHHAWLLAPIDELRDELAHTLVAPYKHRRVVVVADPLIVHHVLQVADDLGGAQIEAARRDQRLVHVQRDHACRLDAAERDLVLRPEYFRRCGGADRLLEIRFAPGDHGQPIDVFGNGNGHRSMNPLCLAKADKPIALRFSSMFRASLDRRNHSSKPATGAQGITGRPLPHRRLRSQTAPPPPALMKSRRCLRGVAPCSPSEDRAHVNCSRQRIARQKRR